MAYLKDVEAANAMVAKHKTWHAVNAEHVVRMQHQNRFKTGLDIAKHTAAIMRADMAAYDKDPSKYTQSLGCWHGYVAQSMVVSLKQHFQSLQGRYVYLSGWMVAAMRSEFGPLPDQSIHEKTSVPKLIDEIYSFLKQADARELQDIFATLDDARATGDKQAEAKAISKIDNFETHVRPIIADIDAGFGNEEATYLLAKKMIEAGACALQLENQVSDAKQCGHQAGKTTVPHEVFLAKVNACRHAFLELGVEDGVIIARTDSLGAGLTQQLPVSNKPGDLASKYIDYVATEPAAGNMKDYDVAVQINGEMRRPKRLPNGLFEFREGTGVDRVVLDCVTSLENGADMIWIETEKPSVRQIGDIVRKIREKRPEAKLVYNNSPSFNWTLKQREEVLEDWTKEGKDISAYNGKSLMDPAIDGTPLGIEADRRIQSFQKDAARDAGIFHHLITLPTFHSVALSTDTLTKGYYADEGMLAYVKGVQREEIRRGLAYVKHQKMAGSDVGDKHKEYFAGEDKALKAGGEANTANQFD